MKMNLWKKEKKAEQFISEDNWPSIKKEFLTTYGAFIKQISLYEYIDLALVPTICLSKKEYV